MTVYLDRQFKAVGRIKKAAGTTHKPTIRRLNEMLTALDETGRYDLLRAIKAGTFTPLQVLEHFRTNDLNKLPTAEMLLPLQSTMERWIEDYECGTRHRESLRQSLRYLLDGATDEPSIAALPARLEAVRKRLKGAGAARSFNLVRSAAQAFIRSTLKRQHRLYLEVASVEPLKVTPVRKKHPLTPAEFVALTEKLDRDIAIDAMMMIRTGMGPSEYWGDWIILGDRVHIYGTKRAGRDRDIPLVLPVWVDAAQSSYREFREALDEATDGTVTPYDLRRSYANHMEAAGIPRTRRRLYLGHGAKDVTDLYETHEVAGFLLEDARKLHSYLVGATAPEAQNA